MTRAYYTSLNSSSPFDRCPFCKPPNCEEKKNPRGSTIEMRSNFLNIMQEGSRIETDTDERRQQEEPATAEGDGHCLATSSKCTRQINPKRRLPQFRKNCSLREIPNGERESAKCAF